MSRQQKNALLKRFSVGSKFYWQVKHKYVAYPQLILVGKWLERCGFISGSKVEVYYSEGRIIITPAREEVNH